MKQHNNSDQNHQANQNRQYATFWVGDMFMGIDLAQVQEMLRYQDMTAVPLASIAVQGLINLRGEIVTALDVRQILKMPRLTSADARPMNIVVRTEDGPVSLLVDEISDVLDVPLEAATAVPENMAPEQRALIEGVYRLESALLLVLNTRQVLDSAAA